MKEVNLFLLLLFLNTDIRKYVTMVILNLLTIMNKKKRFEVNGYILGEAMLLFSFLPPIALGVNS